MFVGFCHTATQISHNYTHILSLPSLPPLCLSDSSRSSLTTRLGSLFSTTTSHKLSTLYLIVYICWCYFLHSFHSLPPTLGSQVHSLHLCLHSFPANKFTNISFLGFIHMYIYICTLIYYVIFFLSYFTLYNRF